MIAIMIASSKSFQLLSADDDFLAVDDIEA